MPRATSYSGRYPSVDPGELKHPITFLDQTVTNDASGVGVKWAPAPSPVVTNAKIDEPRGATVIKSGQDVTQVDATVTIRYRPGITPNKRFQDKNGNVYLILSITKPRGMNVFLVMQCVILGGNA